MFEFNGRVRTVGPQKSGLSQTTGKEWKFMDVLFDYGWRQSQDGTQYNDSIVLQVWNEQLDNLMSIQPGTMLHVMFSTNTRDYNGKPYNDLRVFKIEPMQMQAQAPMMQQQPMMQPQYGYQQQVQPVAPQMQQQMPFQPPVGAPVQNPSQGQPMAQTNNGAAAGAKPELPF